MLKTYKKRVNLIQNQCLSVNHSSELFDSVNEENTTNEISQCDSLDNSVSELQDEICFLDNSEVGNININDSLSARQKQELNDVLVSFRDVMSNNPGRTDALTHKINLHRHEPFKSKNYSMPLHLAYEFNKEIDKMLEMNVIQPSSSDYCLPVVFVRKPDGSLRLCIDFRCLNKNNIFYAEPMPSIGDNLHKFCNAKFFTELDLTKGYRQIRLDPESMKYTAFATKYGLMEFTVMPFGLSTACATFVRRIAKSTSRLG